MNRRRFLTISAALLAAGPGFAAPPLRRIGGQALGAQVSLLLAHPDADGIGARALAEIARLEAIFSLHRDSALARLNRDGRLDAPPFELLDCLSIASCVHEVTGGLFDPTVQPLWKLHAERFAAGAAPTDAEVADARTLTGWDSVRYDATEVRFLRLGMQLTLNGIAQGYIADRVAALLRAEGLSNLLIDTGEIQALGQRPEGGDWQVTLDMGQGRLALWDQALASSAPRGTTFDVAGREGHILDPRTGRPAPSPWRLVSVTAHQAAVADAASTALCLMDRAGMEAALGRLPSARLVALV
ncbi:FAD:protein FMN transferase [Rhodobacter sp. NSM]|uniref:FAD:protein FMN transferase n=1 Tax=Rhodobacter sp. NSM TaxID=3457501 RepID=UPI003FD40623